MKRVWIYLMLIIPTSLFAQSIESRDLSYEECRSLAIENNREIKIANEKLSAATSLQRGMKTNFLPNFSFSASAIYWGEQFSLETEDLTLPSGPLDNTGNPVLNPDGTPLFDHYTFIPGMEIPIAGDFMYRLDFGVVQPIYMGGKIRSAHKATLAAEQAAMFQIELSKAEVIARVDKSYWSIVSLNQKLELTERYRTLLSDLISDVENYYNEGMATQNDLLQVKVKYNEIDLLHFKISNGIALSEMALNQLMGLNTQTPLVLSDSLNELLISRCSDDNYKERALSQRQELRMLEQAVEADKALVKVAKSDFLPQLGVGANYYYQNPDMQMNDDGDFNWTVGASLSVPVFHFGEAKHKVNEKQAQVNIRQHQIDEARELIGLQVQQSVYKVNESVQQIEMTRLSLEQADENLRMANDNLKEGVLRSTDVLEAQALWQSAYSEFIDAKVEYVINRTELKKSIGELGVQK